MTQAFIALNKVEDLTSLVGNHEAAWRMVGACNQSDPDLAFKGDANKEYEGDEYARDAMKGLCISCPIAERCLDHAMVNDERFGIWGGLTTRERDEHQMEWQKSKGKDGMKSARRRYGLGLLDAGKREGYEIRLGKAREARAKLAQSHLEGYGAHQEILDLLIQHPETPCTLLAVRMGRSRTWFENRFREVCEVLHV